jgi:hypothetical protein
MSVGSEFREGQVWEITLPDGSRRQIRIASDKLCIMSRIPKVIGTWVGTSQPGKPSLKTMRRADSVLIREEQPKKRRRRPAAIEPHETARAIKLRERLRLVLPHGVSPSEIRKAAAAMVAKGMPMAFISDRLSVSRDVLEAILGPCSSAQREDQNAAKDADGR